jgi:cold shock protein
MLTGVVRDWHRDAGWGVIDCDATPGGCWAHFSAVEADGYRELTIGETVHFTAGQGAQDGFAYRVVQLWRSGAKPGVATHQPSGPDDAYRSVLAVVFDEDVDG